MGLVPCTFTLVYRPKIPVVPMEESTNHLQDWAPRIHSTQVWTPDSHGSHAWYMVALTAKSLRFHWRGRYYPLENYRKFTCWTQKSWNFGEFPCFSWKKPLGDFEVFTSRSLFRGPYIPSSWNGHQARSGNPFAHDGSMGRNGFF